MADYELGFKKYVEGGIIRRTLAGSYTAEYNRDGGRKRQTFETEAEARDWIKKFEDKRNKAGEVLMSLTAGQLQDAYSALRLLQKAGEGATLLSVIESHAARKQADEANKTLGTVREWYDKYIDYLTRPDDGGDQARPRTLGNKKRLRTFLEVHGETEATLITKQEVENWLKWTKAGGRNLRNYKTEIQSLFNFIEKRNETYRNTVARFPQRKKKQVDPAEIYTPKQAERALRELEKIDAQKPAPNSHAARTSALVVALGCFGGIRTSELIDGEGLQWEAINLQAKTIHVSAAIAKGRKARDISINNTLLAWIRKYRTDAKGKPCAGRVAPSRTTFDAWKNKAKAAGAEFIDNAARHSFGTYYGKLKGYRNAAELMGHIGTMAVFEAHYKGETTKKEAQQFFAIMPTKSKPPRAGK